LELKNNFSDGEVTMLVIDEGGNGSCRSQVLQFCTQQGQHPPQCGTNLCSEDMQEPIFFTDQEEAS
jgi:hypothetical protein